MPGKCTRNTGNSLGRTVRPPAHVQSASYRLGLWGSDCLSAVSGLCNQWMVSSCLPPLELQCLPRHTCQGSVFGPTGKGGTTEVPGHWGLGLEGTVRQGVFLTPFLYPCHSHHEVLHLSRPGATGPSCYGLKPLNREPKSTWSLPKLSISGVFNTD